MITIYGKQSAPYCQKVLAMAAAADLPFVCRENMNDEDRAFVTAVSPNGTTPVILDSDTHINVCESNAILLYLADKTGKLMPIQGQARADTYQWLLFESSTLSAAVNEIYHYLCAAPIDVPYALERNRKRLLRCMEIADKRLAEQPYFCSEMSIADIAIHPWLRLVEEFTDRPLATFTHVVAWSERMNTFFDEKGLKRPA